MQNPKSASVRRKIIQIAVLVNFSTLLLSGAVFITYEMFTTRNSLVEQLRVQAKLIAANLEAPLISGQADVAMQRLSTLTASSGIVNATLYDANNQVYCQILASEGLQDAAVIPESTLDYRFDIHFLSVWAPVLNGEVKLGVLCIQMPLDQVYGHIWQWVVLVAGLSLAAGIIAYAATMKLGTRILAPLVHLTNIAHIVTAHNNYSIRAQKLAEDELGTLADWFNDMLSKIQRRDIIIQQHLNNFEEKVSRRTNELRTANQAKSDFLANVSHEIRTPMNAILGFSELLKNLSSGELQKSYLHNIIVSGKNLLTLINDILDLSKIEAGRMSLQYDFIDLHPFLQEIADIYSYKALEKQLKFHLEIDTNIRTKYSVDEMRLRQVLINLVNNAIKFTHVGSVRLRLSSMPIPRVMNKANLIFEISDTGIGIPPDQQVNIFKAFVQQNDQDSRKYGGTGLGLSISKNLVEMMNGDIQLQSSAGTGSTFTVTLREVDINPDGLTGTSSKPQTIEPDSIQFNPATVLLVEDNEANRQLILEYLSGTALNVIEAVNGQKALEVMQTATPSVILMDMGMPVMDGYTCAGQIRQNEAYRNMPIIALTARVMKPDRLRAQHAGVDVILGKPVTRAELFAVLMDYIPFTRAGVGRSFEGKTPQPEVDFSHENISPQQVSEINQLIEKLQNEMMEAWQEVSQTMVTNEIREFGLQIKNLGERHMISSLSTYGEQLENYACNFQVEELGAVLGTYPQVVQDLSGSMTGMGKANTNPTKRAEMVSRTKATVASNRPYQK